MTDRIESLEQFALRAYSGSIPPEKVEMLARMRANPLPQEPLPSETLVEFEIRFWQAWYRTLTPTEQSYLSAEWKALFGVTDD